VAPLLARRRTAGGNTEAEARRDCVLMVRALRHQGFAQHLQSASGLRRSGRRNDGYVIVDLTGLRKMGSGGELLSAENVE
jgi:hypothetical protein